MIEFLIENKQWIFSGIGVFALTIIWSFLKSGKRNSATIKGASNVVQQDGTSSDNEVNIDGDMNNIKQG